MKLEIVFTIDEVDEELTVDVVKQDEITSEAATPVINLSCDGHAISSHGSLSLSGFENGQLFLKGYCDKVTSRATHRASIPEMSNYIKGITACVDAYNECEGGVIVDRITKAPMIIYGGTDRTTRVEPRIGYSAGLGSTYRSMENVCVD